MSRTARYGLAALALLLLGWYLSGFERVLVREQIGYTGEARLRPFLAAERFAERMGLRARELRSLPELDKLRAGSGVLLLPRRRQALEPRRVQQLLSWAAGGGHLIVEAEPEGVRDPVLEAARIARSADPGGYRTVQVEIPGSGRKLKASGFSAARLEAAGQAPRFRAGPGGAERILSVARGKGLVTAAVDLDFARNRLIGQDDHAELLWVLLNLRPAGELLVLHHPQRLSLWGFLAQHAAFALWAAGALLALWLWRIAPRYGTLQPDPPPARRRLLDHLRASGRYLWSHGLRARLAAAAREGALRRVARAYPDFAAAAPAEQAARLARLADLAPAEAAQLLAPPGEAPGGADFMRLAHFAQRVHHALERGKR